jgi:hypothetical protein
MTLAKSTLFVCLLALGHLRVGSADESNHKYTPDEEVKVWANKVGPYHNPQVSEHAARPVWLPHGQLQLTLILPYRNHTCTTRYPSVDRTNANKSREHWAIHWRETHF